MIDRFEVQELTDEEFAVVDRATSHQLVHLSHDEDGWAGIDRVRETVAQINQALNRLPKPSPPEQEDEYAMKNQHS